VSSVHCEVIVALGQKEGEGGSHRGVPGVWDFIPETD
jgi:hypothetical protein